MTTQNSTDIILINQDSGYLTIDIANNFADAGFSVTLITGRLVVRNNPLKDAVRIRKIIKYERKTNFLKLATWVIAFSQILLFVKFKYRKASLFLVSNPPISTFLPIFVNNKFSLLIFDIYPDAISEMGFLKADSFILKVWERANKKVFKKAESLFTITDGMKNCLQKYSGEKNIEVVPVWSDNEFMKPLAAEMNPFIHKHKLDGKFIVIYSGNIGTSQNIDALVDIAAEVKRTNIEFVIIGDGSQRKYVEGLVKKYKLTNCILLPWQDNHDMPYSFAAANVAVVSLGKLSSSLAIPSKFYNFLSVGAVILGFAMPGTELEQMIEKFQVGRCFKPDDKNKIINYIYYLADHPEVCLSIQRNAISASRQFTSNNVKKFLPQVKADIP
jgi:glycosyltransferase involved in cell wall biosynthesis